MQKDRKYFWLLFVRFTLKMKSFYALSWQFQPTRDTTWLYVLLLPPSGYQMTSIYGLKAMHNDKGLKRHKKINKRGINEQDNRVYFWMCLFWEEFTCQNRFTAALCASVNLHWHCNYDILAERTLTQWSGYIQRVSELIYTAVFSPQQFHNLAQTCDFSSCEYSCRFTSHKAE